MIPIVTITYAAIAAVVFGVVWRRRRRVEKEVANHRDKFDQFAKRFVYFYWKDVANNESDMPPNEPCEESLEEILADITWEITQAQDRYFLAMRCVSSDDGWWFDFSWKRNSWASVAAKVGSPPNYDRVDLLDDLYKKWFGPFLQKAIDRAVAG